VVSRRTSRSRSGTRRSDSFRRSHYGRRMTKAITSARQTAAKLGETDDQVEPDSAGQRPSSMTVRPPWRL
jgi:hypothetical protein